MSEPINFRHYIWKDGYSSIIYIQNTKMMRIAEFYIDYIPEELMRNTVRDIYRKMSNSGSSRRCARTNHAQVTATFRRNLPFILDSLQSEITMTDERYEEHAKTIREALEEAKLIEEEAERMAEEDHRMRSGGNIRFHRISRTANS